jgi:glycosyltransferase involved in cell wall biosynthesis
LIQKEIIVFNSDVPAGVSTILKNIIRYSPRHPQFHYKLILYRYADSNRHGITEDWCDQVARIELSHFDNLYHSLGILKKYITSHSIIVANDILELRLAALLRLKNPLIYIVHGDFETYYIHCDMFQDYMDTIITYSKHIFDKLRKRLKTDNIGKLKLIYYPAPELEVLPKPKNEFRIVFAGSLIRRKGVDLLPGIIHHLDQHLVNYQLHILGSGEQEEWLRGQLGQNDKVKFWGQQPQVEVLKQFQYGHVFLFPTRSEGMPNVLVEAMKAGCVPVVSNIPSGIPDLVFNGKNGILVAPDDIKGFSEGILRLHRDREKLMLLGTAAVDTAKKMFDPFVNAQAYFDAFRQTPEKDKIPEVKINTGRLLNKSWLPNLVVKRIRRLGFSKKL